MQRHHHHEQLLSVDGPAIIIAGSGMCTGGRIINHLAHGIEDPRNDILFVGYTAHADQQGLLDWVARHAPAPHTIKLVHGEPPARTALSTKLTEKGHTVC